jgi:threonine synthase
MMLDLGLVSRRPRIVCAQAEAANPLYLAYQTGFRVFEPIAARPTLASAIQIGNPVSIEKAIDAIRRYNGIVEQASEAELVEACAHADRTGLFNCPHTGVALAAMRKLVSRGVIRKGDRVVVISTAHGLKFTDFKVRYHSMSLDGIVAEVPNPPIDLPARYETVRDEMMRQIEHRFGRGSGTPSRAG